MYTNIGMIIFFLNFIHIVSYISAKQGLLVELLQVLNLLILKYN